MDFLMHLSTQWKLTYLSLNNQKYVHKVYLRARNKNKNENKNVYLDYSKYNSKCTSSLAEKNKNECI